MIQFDVVGRGQRVPFHTEFINTRTISTVVLSFDEPVYRQILLNDIKASMIGPPFSNIRNSFSPKNIVLKDPWSVLQNYDSYLDIYGIAIRSLVSISMFTRGMLFATTCAEKPGEVVYET